MPATGQLVVGITGASGAIYAVRFLEHAATSFRTLYVTVSEHAQQVIVSELHRPRLEAAAPTAEWLLGHPCPNLVFLDRKDYFTPPASGSFRHDGMVIVPCSMGTAGRIAAGVSDDLITRAADVCLKEGRKLVLVLRETPWSLIHLRNLAALAEAGAVIMPASPSFYNNPSSVEDLVDTVVARILQQLGVEQEVVPQWQFIQAD
ncbi:MAG: UbiX family flavin prenyltransferase [Chthonomonadales bacterium]